MKKNALVVIGIVAVLALGIIGVSAKTIAPGNNNSVVKSVKPITLEAARKLALKKQPGDITKEVTTEDEGKISTYIFKITAKDGKKMEVEIEADSGEVLYAGEASEDEEEEDTDPGQ